MPLVKDLEPIKDLFNYPRLTCENDVTKLVPPERARAWKSLIEKWKKMRTHVKKS